MGGHKLRFLNHRWNGWRYILIKGKEFEEELIEVHEIYQIEEDNLSVSWTAEPVSIPVGREYYQEVLDMYDDGLIFTEEELMEWNESCEQ